jgi:hypothetical protein
MSSSTELTARSRLRVHQGLHVQAVGEGEDDLTEEAQVVPMAGMLARAEVVRQLVLAVVEQPHDALAQLRGAERRHHHLEHFLLVDG